MELVFSRERTAEFFNLLLYYIYRERDYKEILRDILFYQQIGLAVGDIDKIQQKSVMARYVMQV